MAEITRVDKKELYYRGYYGNLGVHNPKQSFIWITNDKEYAAMYGNRVAIFETNFDYSKIADCYETENLLDEFNQSVGIEYDPVDILYMPTEAFVSFVRQRGYNGFFLKDDCLCLLNKKLLGI